jgi:hypothetical protein
MPHAIRKIKSIGKTRIEKSYTPNLDKLFSWNNYIELDLWNKVSRTDVLR